MNVQYIVLFIKHKHNGHRPEASVPASYTIVHNKNATQDLEASCKTAAR